MGYLFCEKCGGYYELQKGENIDDFWGCECGGKFEYYETLDVLKYPDNNQDIGGYSKESMESYDKLKKAIKRYNDEKSGFNRENLSLKALLIGFIIGLIPVPFITSIIGGILVGFIAGGSYKRGAFHGLIAGIISLSAPIYILTNPLGSGTDLLISIIAISLIVSIIPTVIASLFGTAIRKRVTLSSRMDPYKYTSSGSKIKWWNNMDSKGQAILIIAAYFIVIALFVPFINFNDLNYISNDVSSVFQPQVAVNTSSDIDEQLKVKAFQMIEKDGYWSSYQRKLKNNLVKGDYYIGGMVFENAEIDKDSIKVSSLTNDSFIVQYEAIHNAAYISNQGNTVYFEIVYIYTEKAVKEDEEWILAGYTKKPIYLEDESYKSWYSQSKNLWYREKINSTN